MSTLTPRAQPWYRHGLVWLLILLPASVVVASLATLWIAIENPSSLVRDDYYRDGLAINRRLDQARTARERGIQATLAYDRDGGTLRLRIEPALLPERLALALVHPTDAERDELVVLERIAPGLYEARHPVPIDGRRHLQLGEPGTAGAWLLQGTLDARASGAVKLLPADG